jgi:pseudaminic acid cytidylyltransferase
MKNFNIAVIPARKGSKRLPNKNIKNFLGKPLINYSITAAKKSKLFDKIIVSTDSVKIKNISTKLGADTSDVRNKSLFDDNTQINDVMSDITKNLIRIYPETTGICCIFPAAPLIDHISLIKSYNLFKKRKYNYVFSAAKYSHNVERGFKINKNKIQMLFPKNYFSKSQIFTPVYRDAAQFYWGTIDAWINKRKFFAKNSRIYEIESFFSHDLDDREDLNTIKNIYKIKMKK